MTTPRAAGILFIAGDQILLLQRQGDCDHSGTWGLPFGKIEAGETPLDAAMRETFEECGYLVVGDILPFADDDGCITHVAQLEESFEPVLNDEHGAFMWASLDNLPSPLHPALVGMTEFADTMDFLDTARGADFNGFMTINANPISKVGVFPYLGKNIPGAADPDRIYWVYRPAEELADPECIESFKLLPWIDNHAMLGKEESGNTPAERKGVHGVMGENIFFEGDTLYANLKVFSEALADLIDSGKTELSAGYRSRYEWTEGVWNGKHYDCIQRCLRGNHLALVETGRMGPEVSVLDHMTFTIDTEDVMTKKELQQLQAIIRARTAKVTRHAATMDADDPKDDATAQGDKPEVPKNGEPGDNPNAADESAVDSASNMSVNDAVAAFEAMMPLLEKLIAAANLGNTPAAAADDAVVDPEAMVATMDAAIQRAQGKTFDAVVKHLAARDALASRLSAHVGTFDAAEMTLAQVAAYGVQKLELTADKGQEIAVLNGYMQAKPAARVTRHADAMDASEVPKDNAVARHLAKLNAA